MTMKRSAITVRVPATSANLGPGFDTLGIALGLYNELEVTPRDPASQEPCITIAGEGSGILPDNQSNAVWQAMKRTFALLPGHASIAQFGSFTLRQTNGIPLVSGLGSSAAARLCGILAANEIMGGKLTEEKLLSLGAELEGHPDNIVPAMLGGFCVSAQTPGGLKYIKLAPPRLKAVVCHPAFDLPTKQARQVLPKQIPFAAAVFTVSRVGLLMAALQSGRYDLLWEGMDDKLHQPFRARLIPGLRTVIDAAGQAGACGAALSGAGPSVIAFCPADRADKVGQSMKDVWAARKVSSTWYVLNFETAGARVRTTGRPRARRVNA